MLKLLIVDDEQVEREGMQLILEADFPNLTIEQAKNGQMAVEMADDFKPDLILMDIKMPGMNGLEAVEKISAEHPTTQFIMVTAYDTVDYLRHAIKLGVNDYLLKPSTADEIIATVGTVLEKIKAEKQSLEKNKLQHQQTLALIETDIVTQLLFDHVHDVHVDMLLERLSIPANSKMAVILVVLPIGSEGKYTEVKEIVRKTNSGLVGALNGNQLPIILFRNSTESSRSQTTKLAREILSINKSGAEGWFVGIGNTCNSLDEIRVSYQQAVRATVDTSLPVKYRFYSDDTSLNVDQLGKHKEKEFADQVRLGQWELVRVYIVNVITYYENKNSKMLLVQQKVLEVLWEASRVMNDIGIDVETPLYSTEVTNYRQLSLITDHLLEDMKNAYNKHYENLEADTIHQLKQYIFDNSEHDISLEALGELVGLSPIYISKMFKEKLGINYIDFLTQCRLKKAKKLLVETDKSIKEITYDVGYHDPNYFSKVFKKMCETTPMEYRKKLLGKNV
jgi:two-component system, response regulator YesN